VPAARPQHRWALAGLVIGLVLVTGPVALWSSGAPWFGGAGSGSSGGDPRAEISAPVAGPVLPADPVVDRDPVAGAAAEAAAPAAPVRIRLVDLGVDVPVVDVGVDDKGEMAVPEDVRTVGWYRFGPGPGAAAGSAVLSGHVDDRVQGRGAFYRLPELATGNLVEVDLADGTRLRYRVRTVERVAKSDLPVDRIFARDGNPTLTLVTCGGNFDWTTRRYRENVVATAEPEGGAQ